MILKVIKRKDGRKVVVYRRRGKNTLVPVEVMETTGSSKKDWQGEVTEFIGSLRGGESSKTS